MRPCVLGGGKYFNEEAEGHLLMVRQVLMFDFDDHKRIYLVRREGGKVQLWDDVKKWVVGER